jgi:hypothetical protein
VSASGRISLRQRVQERRRWVALHLPFPRGRAHAEEPSGGGARAIVTLTTIPSRISRLRPTLASLLDQTRPPDAIVLNLPLRCEREARGYALPGFLAQLPELRVERCERDWGPATKLIPTLLRLPDPDAALIVVDDDQIYPRELVSNLLHWSESHPEAALCHRGFRVPRNLEHARRNTLYAEHQRRPEPVEIIQGSAGYLVKPRFFGPDLLDYHGAPAAAHTRDDVWISGHLARAGVERLVVPLAGCRSRLTRPAVHRNRALSHRENRDDREGKALYHHFLSDWRLLD